MLVAIYGRKLKSNVIPLVNLLLEELTKRNFQYIMYALFYQHLKKEHALNISCKTFTQKKEIPNETEFVFTLGGDGTILDAVSWIGKREIPVLGINFGRLGFLASIPSESIIETLDALINKTYEIDYRTMVGIESSSPIFEESAFALNEFTVQRSETSSMITVHTFINQQHLNSYWADGLIVSTPTGSTGYSLSCGGPIIHPHSKSFVITPISPHNLNVRPMIIPDDVEITLRVEGRSKNFLATLDSRVKTFDSSIELKLTKTRFNARLVRMSKTNFVTAIREKLLWGEDMRN